MIHLPPFDKQIVIIIVWAKHGFYESLSHLNPAREDKRNTALVINTDANDSHWQ